jgi:thiamine pyrophosphokinase
MTADCDCLIIAGGEFPHLPTLIDDLRAAKCLIACDGAVTNLLRVGITPTHIVGDLDSLTPDLRERFADIVCHNPDQETNDLTKAARFAEQLGCRRIAILGATGLREDHTLGNISLLTDYVRRFESVKMISDYGTFIPITQTTTFRDIVPGTQVSLFAIFPFGSITSSGLRYPISERKLPVWWEGTLNEALSTQFTLTMEGEGNLLVYLAHPWVGRKEAR